ncbi:MAG: HU family DNA-binding protein [Opitutales bacterium]
MSEHDAVTSAMAVASGEEEPESGRIGREGSPAGSEFRRVLSRAELIDEIAYTCDTSQKEAKAILEVVLDSMVRALRNGDWVQIRRFGTFRTRTRRARAAVNPRNGERIRVPAKRIPYFKASKELAEALAAGPEK